MQDVRQPIVTAALQSPRCSGLALSGSRLCSSAADPTAQAEATRPPLPIITIEKEEVVP